MCPSGSMDGWSKKCRQADRISGFPPGNLSGHNLAWRPAVAGSKGFPVADEKLSSAWPAVHQTDSRRNVGKNPTPRDGSLDQPVLDRIARDIHIGGERELG